MSFNISLSWMIYLKVMKSCTILVSVIAGICLSACSSRTFSKKDIRSAQKIIGLSYSDNDIRTMHGYLERNKRGYDSMRSYPLDELTTSVISYNLLPDDFEIPAGNDRFEISAPVGISIPENENEIAFRTIDQLAYFLRNGSITSVQLTNIYLDRIKKYDAQLQSVVTLIEDEALAEAAKRDEELANGLDRGPLHGIPYGIKDLFAVEGYPTTWGSEPFRNQQFDYTSTVANKLREAGAVLIAKLTSGALARGDVWFDGKTRNPWNPKEGAAGSSAGSGAATAAGLVGFSIGTETLGSIVSPSSRNGVSGLRPTYGRVSRYGVMPLSWSLDKVGPICRSARGCAIVFNVIRGADKQDNSTIDAAFTYNEGSDLTKYRVAYFEDLFGDDSSRYNLNNTGFLDEIRGLGITLTSISLPEEIPYDVFDIILRAEAGAFFDQLVLSGEVDQMVQQNEGSRANSLRQSRFIPAVEYLQANRHRKILVERIHELFQDYDVILAPTFGGNQLLTTNLTGHPVFSLPTGLNKDQLPTSITLIGNLFEEGKLLEFANMYQNKFRGPMIPPLFKD